MTTDLARMTAEIVAAQLASTPMPADEVPGFMLKVRDQLVRIADEDAAPAEPARTIHPDALAPGLLDERWPGVYQDRIVCLDDGRSVKLLRSYLTKKYGISGDDYRRRWRLPADYPFAPPDYVDIKRAAAQAGGLGTRVRANRERRGDGA